MVLGFIDQFSHRQRWARDELLGDASSVATEVIRFAPVVTEGELVEIGLKLLAAHGATLGAKQPAFQVRDRRVADLQCVVFAPLGFRLHDNILQPLAEARHVVAGVTVRYDLGFRGDQAVCEPI